RSAASWRSRCPKHPSVSRHRSVAWCRCCVGWSCISRPVSRRRSTGRGPSSRWGRITRTPRRCVRRSAAWSSTRKTCTASRARRRSYWWRSRVMMVDEGDRLLVALLRFVALLRRLGMTVGTGQALDAARALTLVDLSCRDDVYAALRAVLLDAHTHEQVFAAAFERFWSGLAPLIEERAATALGYAPAQGPRPRGEGGEDRNTTAERMLLLAGDDDLMGADDPGM